jgi:hypothetical protein
MTLEEAYAVMDEGGAITRANWEPGSYMIVVDGVEKTYNATGTVIALGYRSFGDEDDKYLEYTR